MFCIMCGVHNPDHAVYCRNCGRELSDQRIGVPHAPEPPTPRNEVGRCPAATPEETPFEPALLAGASTEHIAVEAPVPEPQAPSATQVESGEVPSPDDNGTECAQADWFPATPEVAQMGTRFVAYLADLSVVYVAVILFYFVLGLTGHYDKGWEESERVVVFVTIMVYMTLAQAAYHTTVGKYICGYEITSLHGNRQPSFLRVLVRETIGRFVSSMFFGVGYWRAVKDPLKQAWSDQIAVTVVSRRATNKSIRRALIAFVILASVADLATMVYGEWSEQHDKDHETAIASMKASSAEVSRCRELVISAKNLEGSDWATLQANMRLVLSRLDTYDSALERYAADIDRYIQQKLYVNETDRQQCVALKKAVDLRKEQNRKLRLQANLIVNTEPRSRAETAEVVSQLGMLDSDIASLDKRASETLKDAGIQ